MRLFVFSMVLANVVCAAQADDRREAAAQMLAIATFAADCPGIKPDYAMMRSSFDALGVIASEKDSDLLLRSMIIMAKLNENKDRNCKLSWEQFGQDGKALPGLLKRN